MADRGFDIDLAATHLRRDRRFAAWMCKVEPIVADPRWRASFDPVDALARAILYQQLSGKAAATIVGRVELAAGSKRLNAGALARIDNEALRACGVSGNKQLALRDLTTRAERGEIPTLRHMLKMSDDEIIAALTPVRGIGRWTVEMLLIFRLGRPDVFPVDDLGIRKGMQIVLRTGEMPASREALPLSTRWGPYRTLASLYLWRIADAAKETATAPPRAQK